MVPAGGAYCAWLWCVPSHLPKHACGWTAVIFEALSLVRRAAHEGKISKSRGALYVGVIKRVCADRGFSLAPPSEMVVGLSVQSTGSFTVSADAWRCWAPWMAMVREQ
jgi:hypothetical protein